MNLSRKKRKNTRVQETAEQKEERMTEQEEKKETQMPETDPETMTANSAQAEDATEAEDMTEKDAGQAKAQGSPENAPEAEEAEGNGEPDSESPEEQPAKKERKLKWAKPDPLEEKIKEANDKYARLFAEFDNFRKRTEKEKSQRYDFGVRDIVEKILPVIDNFERGLAAVPEEKAEDSFVTGMQMTYKQLMKTLEDAGVKPIEAVGQEFNPDFHNAVMHVEDPEAGTNIIVEEFQKGYIYKDHVVRYSMVKVAN